ncbi:hypothetical protein WA158_002396 [Blastocystis sp. Blastoise]
MQQGSLKDKVSTYGNYAITYVLLPLWCFFIYKDLYLSRYISVFLILNTYIFPYVYAWIATFLVSKFAKIKFKIKDIYFLAKPLSLIEINSVQAIVHLKKFTITVSIERVSLRTNFLDSIFSMHSMSSLLLEIKNVQCGIVLDPNSESSSHDSQSSSSSQQTIDQSSPDVSLDSPDLLNKKTASVLTKINSIIGSFLPITRFFSIRITQGIITLGDTLVPVRFTLTLNEIKESSNLQYMPEPNLAFNIDIQTIILSSYEADQMAEKNPDVFICNFRISLFSIITGRKAQMRLFSVNIGDYIHFRLNKGLFRQIYVIQKSFQKKSSSTKKSPPLPSSPLSSIPTISSSSSLSLLEMYLLHSDEQSAQVLQLQANTAVQTFKNLLLLLPCSIRIDLSKVEIDIISKDNNKKNNLNINIVWTCNMAIDRIQQQILGAIPYGLQCSLHISKIAVNQGFKCNDFVISTEILAAKDVDQLKSVSTSLSLENIILNISPNIFNYINIIKSVVIYRPNPSTANSNNKNTNNNNTNNNNTNNNNNNNTNNNNSTKSMKISISPQNTIPSQTIQLSSLKTTKSIGTSSFIKALGYSFCQHATNTVNLTISNVAFSIFDDKDIPLISLKHDLFSVSITPKLVSSLPRFSIPSSVISTEAYELSITSPQFILKHSPTIPYKERIHISTPSPIENTISNTNTISTTTKDMKKTQSSISNNTIPPLSSKSKTHRYSRSNTVISLTSPPPLSQSSKNSIYNTTVNNTNKTKRTISMTPPPSNSQKQADIHGDNQVKYNKTLKETESTSSTINKPIQTLSIDGLALSLYFLDSSMIIIDTDIKHIHVSLAPSLLQTVIDLLDIYTLAYKNISNTVNSSLPSNTTNTINNNNCYNTFSMPSIPLFHKNTLSSPTPLLYVTNYNPLYLQKTSLMIQSIRLTVCDDKHENECNLLFKKIQYTLKGALFNNIYKFLQNQTNSIKENTTDNNNRHIYHNNIPDISGNTQFNPISIPSSSPRNNMNNNNINNMNMNNNMNNNNISQTDNTSTSYSLNHKSQIPSFDNKQQISISSLSSSDNPNTNYSHLSMNLNEQDPMNTDPMTHLSSQPLSFSDMRQYRNISYPSVNTPTTPYHSISTNNTNTPSLYPQNPNSTIPQLSIPSTPMSINGKQKEKSISNPSLLSTRELSPSFHPTILPTINSITERSPTTSPSIHPMSTMTGNTIPTTIHLSEPPHFRDRSISFHSSEDPSPYPPYKTRNRTFSRDDIHGTQRNDSLGGNTIELSFNEKRHEVQSVSDTPGCIYKQNIFIDNIVLTSEYNNKCPILSLSQVELQFPDILLCLLSLLISPQKIADTHICHILGKSKLNSFNTSYSNHFRHIIIDIPEFNCYRLNMNSNPSLYIDITMGTIYYFIKLFKDIKNVYTDNKDTSAFFIERKNKKRKDSVIRKSTPHDLPSIISPTDISNSSTININNTNIYDNNNSKNKTINMDNKNNNNIKNTKNNLSSFIPINSKSTSFSISHIHSPSYPTIPTSQSFSEIELINPHQSLPKELSSTPTDNISLDSYSIFTNNLLYLSTETSKPSDYRQFIVSIPTISIFIGFSEKQRLQFIINDFSILYNNPSVVPLFSISSLTCYQIKNKEPYIEMMYISAINVFPPHQYTAALDTVTCHTIPAQESTRKNPNKFKTSCSCNSCHKCHRFVPCYSCLKNEISHYQCNGYDSECYLHSGHVPEDITPYILEILSIELTQDGTMIWGDIMDDIIIQWKAFKVMWKGPPKPIPCPHPDLQLYATSSSHPPITSNDLTKGGARQGKGIYWVRFLCQHFSISFLEQDKTIPSENDSLFVASRMIMNDIDSVILYDTFLHNRGHMLRYITELDSCDTPLTTGFDDIYRAHIHSLFCTELAIYLDDYPYPYIHMQNPQLCGTFAATSINRVDKFCCTQQTSLFTNHFFPDIPVEILRCSVGMKVFQNFILQSDSITFTWGPGITLMRQQFSTSFGNLTSKSVSKSIKLPWFDKIRFMCQGPVTIQTYDSFQVLYLVKTAYDVKDCFIISAEGLNLNFPGKGEVHFTCDVFSFIVSQLYNGIQKYTPIFESSYLECSILLKWLADFPYEHYVELLRDSNDDYDKFSSFRSHQLRWTIKINSQSKTSYQTLFFIRGELLSWLMNFYNILNAPSNDMSIGIMRMSQRFDIEWNIKNAQLFLFIDDDSMNGIEGRLEDCIFNIHVRKYFPLYYKKKGKQDLELKDLDFEYDYYDLRYEPEIYINSNWKFPLLAVTIQNLHIVFVDLPESSKIHYSEGSVRYHPFQNTTDACFLEVFQIKKIALVKSRKMDFSMDADIINMYTHLYTTSYNNTTRSTTTNNTNNNNMNNNNVNNSKKHITSVSNNNGSNGTANTIHVMNSTSISANDQKLNWTIYMLGLQFYYTLDTRDAMSALINDFKILYLDEFPSIPTDADTLETPSNPIPADITSHDLQSIPSNDIYSSAYSSEDETISNSPSSPSSLFNLFPNTQSLVNNRIPIQSPSMSFSSSTSPSMPLQYNYNQSINRTGSQINPRIPNALKRNNSRTLLFTNSNTSSLSPVPASPYLPTHSIIGNDTTSIRQSLRLSLSGTPSHYNHIQHMPSLREDLFSKRLSITEPSTPYCYNPYNSEDLQSIKKRRERYQQYYRERLRQNNQNNQNNSNEPFLLTHLLSLIQKGINVNKDGVLTFVDTFTEEEGQNSTYIKGNKELVFNTVIQDSQIHVKSPETDSSILFFLRNATCSLLRYTYKENTKNEIKAELNEVSLYVASGINEPSDYWLTLLPTNSIRNQGIYTTQDGIESYGLFKCIIQDFSFHIISRSNSGLIPKTKKSLLSINHSQEVDSVMITIPAIKAKMTGEQFYTALNVIRFVLLVNPSNSTNDNNKDIDSEKLVDADTYNDYISKTEKEKKENENISIHSNTSNTNSMLGRGKQMYMQKKEMETIKEKVSLYLKSENNMNIPLLRINYIMEKFEWILLDNTNNEIAIASIYKFKGEHIFCYEGASENKITVNDIQVKNPNPGQQEYEKWKDPSIVLSAQLLDREVSDTTNFLEVIANIRNTISIKRQNISLVEHVGFNVYPGAYYYILFQLSSTVAGKLRDYFFPENDSIGEEEEEEVEEEDNNIHETQTGFSSLYKSIITPNIYITPNNNNNNNNSNNNNSNNNNNNNNNNNISDINVSSPFMNASPSSSSPLINSINRKDGIPTVFSPQTEIPTSSSYKYLNTLLSSPLVNVPEIQENDDDDNSDNISINNNNNNNNNNNSFNSINITNLENQSNIYSKQKTTSNPLKDSIINTKYNSVSSPLSPLLPPPSTISLPINESPKNYNQNTTILNASFVNKNNISTPKTEIVTEQNTTNIANTSFSLLSNERSLNKIQELKIKNCHHQFILCPKPGKCYVCKQKIAYLRNPGYICKLCDILVHPHCRDIALGKIIKKEINTKNKSIYTVWFQHVRVGNVNMVINTRGFTMNIKNLEVSLDPMVYTESMTSWKGLFNRIKRSIINAVVRMAPSLIYRKFSIKPSSTIGDIFRPPVSKLLTEFEEEIKSVEGNEDDYEENISKRKIKLLLGI